LIIADADANGVQYSRVSKVVGLAGLMRRCLQHGLLELDEAEVYIKELAGRKGSGNLAAKWVPGTACTACSQNRAAAAVNLYDAHGQANPPA
jgi:hypothetical protein